VTDERRRVLRSKAVLSTLVFLGVAAMAEAVPKLAPLRVLSSPPRAPIDAPARAAPVAAIGSARVDLVTEDRPDLAQPEHASAPVLPNGPMADDNAGAIATPAEDVNVSPVSISDEHGALARFFAALAESERHVPHAVTRIAYFGDSVVASDFGTGTLRRLLQARFGDAGHGFSLVANAWPQYFQNDVYRYADRGFLVSRIVGPRAADHLYGLGGVSFEASPGMRVRIGTAKTGSFGRSVSRFGVAYVDSPGGGVIDARIDGAPARTIDTNGDKKPSFAEFETSDGAHELELVTSRGNVRLFGVTLERDVPGVVLDAIGIVGARIRTLSENDDSHFAEALAWRKPNLVVFQFGANESADGFAYPMPAYHESMKQVLDRVRLATPDAGCLIIGAMDRARRENEHLVTVPIIPHIVEEQRRVASEVGCAFWSAYDAMGGKGSMARWVRLGLGTGDYTHPTSWGAERLGNWIYSALMQSYASYEKSAHH